MIIIPIMSGSDSHIGKINPLMENKCQIKSLLFYSLETSTFVRSTSIFSVNALPLETNTIDYPSFIVE